MSDPAWEAERRRALRAEEDRARAAGLHDMEIFARRTPGQDRVHVACVRLPGQPPGHAKMLWSTLARLRRDAAALAGVAAASAGGAAITDLGACGDDPGRYRDGTQTFIRWLRRPPEGHRCDV